MSAIFVIVSGALFYVCLAEPYLLRCTGSLGMSVFLHVITFRNCDSVRNCGECEKDWKDLKLE
jgi:hypothetical protein